MDTPIFDGVLGDRLAQAREAVQLAERDGRAFVAALTQGQAQALEQLAQARAESLTRERTAGLTARIAGLESELQRLRDDAETDAETQAPAPVVVPEAPPARVVVAPAAAAVSVAAVHPAATRGDGTVRAGRPATVRTGRLAADAGPTGDDVPSVPSMKDLFASTRAAGWLDQLLGAKR